MAFDLTDLPVVLRATAATATAGDNLIDWGTQKPRSWFLQNNLDYDVFVDVNHEASPGSLRVRAGGEAGLRQHFQSLHVWCQGGEAINGSTAGLYIVGGR